MDSEKVIKRDNEYVLHTYNRNPVVLEKGHGLYAEGPEGQKYLDFTSGIGVNSLGYCDLAWAEAVSQQAHKLQHTSNLYYTAPCGKLAKKLCKRTGMSKVFFGNSGAEANEGAIKAARKYSVDHYGKDRYNVITLVNSFHGRTLATLTATGQEVFHNYFGPFNEGFQYVPAGDIEALLSSMFLHGGIWHLVGNLYFLLICGDNVEDEFGKGKYILLLLASGLCASLLHALFDPRTEIPCVGASGFISGVIACYAVCFPRVRLSFALMSRSVFGAILARRNWFSIPAWGAFALWVVLQIVMAFLPRPGGGGVAYLAHIGGALPGLLFAFYHRFAPKAPSYDSSEYRF